jgi:hypothetical protein
MVRPGIKWTAKMLGVAFCACSFLPAQSPPPLTDSGQIIVDGRPTAYRIRHLPVTSFPDLPDAVADQLTRRGCLIPQTYQAHHPENVVHGSLEHPGSSDWAVLCSTKGTVSLLVFFSSAPASILVLATAPETARLQSHDATGVLGFNWGIDPASPEQVREARSGMEHRPPTLNHDALADTIIGRRTVYHFFLKSEWTLLDMPE